MFVDGSLWRRVAPPLAHQFRTLVPDWPLGAHEHPLAPDADVTLPGLGALVADFLKALDLEDVVLIANDTGGAIAQQVVADHPERVGALVLISCDCFDHFLPPKFRILSLAARVPGAGWLMAQSLRPRPLRRLPLAYGALTKYAPDDALDHYVRRMCASRAGQRDLRRILKAVSRRYTLELAPRLRSFGRPVLVAWAAEERLFPVEYGKRLAEAFPNSRLELIEDSRTAIPEDQPERLVELIREFLA